MALPSSSLFRGGERAARLATQWVRRFDEQRQGQMTERLSEAARQPGLHPAAIRIERSRSQTGPDNGSQTAVTMWFGEGPALPGVGHGNQALRGVMKVGVGVLGAAALAALTAVAAQREARLEAARPQRLAAAPTVTTRAN